MVHAKFRVAASKRARSSARKSGGLLTHWSRVQIPPGPPLLLLGRELAIPVIKPIIKHSRPK